VDKLNKAETTSFHVELLSKLIDIHNYPFSKMIIEKNVTREEYNDLFRMLNTLDKQYRRQKKEGLLDFTILIIHFAGMLTEKLDPNQTIYALKKEGYYPSLMNVFIQIIEFNDIR